ncbi:MAG TPA: heavy-metal-associated domain-containing protein [Ferruginibacter sp.]|nr:heavy-metal-associated domain-containing protein [Ferruginibacter sp.]
MKAISLGFFAVFCTVTTSFAQYQTPKASSKAVIKTPHIQCDVCKDKVTFFLSRHDGVSSVKVDPKRKTTTVSWLNDRTTLENIKVAIANLGFDADDVEAEEYAFKRLPKDCRAHKPPPETPKN